MINSVLEKNKKYCEVFESKIDLTTKPVAMSSIYFFKLTFPKLILWIGYLNYKLRV